MKSTRAGVVIINGDDEVLTLRRVKQGKEYYCFPGGSVEDGETPEEAARREAAEELSLNVVLDVEFARFINEDREEVYYLVRNFEGDAELGGEEKEHMNEGNQYYLEWKSISELKKIHPVYPTALYTKVIDTFS